MEDIIKTAPKEVLLSIDFLWRLAIGVTQLNLSRRATIDWLADVIFGWLERGGSIVDADGREIEVDDELIDRVHGNDQSAIWVSELKKKAEQPPMRRPKSALLARLQLYDAAFKIISQPLT